MQVSSSPLHHPRTIGDILNLPLCFICAKVKEYSEIQAELQEQQRLQNGVRIEYADLFYEEKNFTVGTIIAGQRTVRFFLTHGADQGPESFGIFSSRIFSLLKPQAAVLLGTCAARKGINYRLGDVAFGYSAFNYEEGKYQDEHTFTADFLRRSSTTAQTLIGGFLTNAPKQYKEAIFLTGSAVRQDAQMIFAKWKEPRKADVLDMEASAFFNACLHCHVASLGVVKGVSDNGDEKKSKLMYHTALSNAAAATVGLSKHYVNGSSFPQQPLTLNGKVLAEGYFDNFLTKAIDGLEEIKIVKYLPLQNKPIDKIFLVDPGVDELQSIASQSLGTHIKRCHLEQVAIESDYTRSLILYYKNGKVFDIPTTLNRLQGEGETVVNHALFWSTLKERIRAQRLGKYVDFINFEDLERMCEQA